jgi:hypothetical protein
MAAKCHSINHIRDEAEVSQLLGTPFKLDEIVFSCVINNPSPIKNHAIPPYLFAQKMGQRPKATFIISKLICHP